MEIDMVNGHIMEIKYYHYPSEGTVHTMIKVNQRIKAEVGMPVTILVYDREEKK